jgi:hypothetical protein
MDAPPMFDLVVALLAGIGPAAWVGAVGVATGCVWPLFNSRRRILAIQVAGSLLFALYYWLLGAHTGAAMCVAGALQGVAAATLSRRRALGVIGLTVAVSLGVTALSWAGLSSALAQGGQIASAIGRLRRTPQAIRFSFLGSEAFWTSHNLLVGSRWGLVSDTMAVTTLLIGIGRSWARAPARAKAAHHLALGAARA